MSHDYTIDYIECTYRTTVGTVFAGAPFIPIRTAHSSHTIIYLLAPSRRIVSSQLLIRLYHLFAHYLIRRHRGVAQIRPFSHAEFAPLFGAFTLSIRVYVHSIELPFTVFTFMFYSYIFTDRSQLFTLRSDLGLSFSRLVHTLFAVRTPFALFHGLARLMRARSHSFAAIRAFTPVDANVR
jgi:hypothetical protein